MKLTKRTTTILVLVMACVLFLFSLVFSINPTYAVLPEEYETAAAGEDVEWYFGEDFLNLDALKATVSKWFEDERVYDFSALEKDPIVVAVIDTGIRCDHQIFLGKYDEFGQAVESSDVGEYDVLYRDAEGNIICTNTVVQKGYVTDSIEDDAPDKHGTHVAGTIATLIHELNLEKYIKIMPIKAAYPSGSESSFSLVALTNALDFAVEHGADVINMSLAINDRSFGTIMKNKYADSAVLVAAAGNKQTESVSENKTYYPAGSTNVIGVMNLSYSGTDYVYSGKTNYGSAYEVGAPGTNILSADGTGSAKYKKMTGTSMASPIVAFGAALATLKYSALANATGTQNAKTPRQIANIIKSSVIERNDIPAFDMNVFAADKGLYSVYIDCDEELLVQTAGETSEISLTATLLPENAENAELSKNIKWYEIPPLGEKVLLTTGTSLTYKPQDGIGTTTIVAEYEDENNSFSSSKRISVQHKKPSETDTVIEEQTGDDEKKEYEIGETYTFSIIDYEYYSPTDVIAWYVNGEYKGSGATFEFVPQDYGEYVISVKINFTVIDNAVIVKVEEPKAELNKTYSYVSIGVVAGISLVVGVVALIAFLRKKNQKIEPYVGE